MKCYSTLNIGTFHTLHCEDIVVHEQLGNDLYLIAVMDGCTMGKESVFASHLYAKVLRKASKRIYYESFYDSIVKEKSTVLSSIVCEVLSTVRNTQLLLDLEQEELLSTLLVAVIDTKTKSAEVLCIGDGLVCYNDQKVEFEQNDRPDYLGYHLKNDPEGWYKDQKQRLTLNDLSDLSICTDGIFSFQLSNDSPWSELELIDFLCSDRSHLDYEHGLDRKLMVLKQKQLMPTDDLAMVRCIW